MSRPLLVWLLLSVVWGSTWMFVKVGVTSLPPLTFAWLRFVLAFIPLALVAMLRRSKWPGRKDWPMIAVTGLLTFSINYALVYWGEIHISSALAAILYTTLPLFGLILAHIWIPGEQMTRRKLFGVLLAMAGVILIFGDRLKFGGPEAVWGVAAIVLASLCTAVAGTIIKLRAHHLDPIVFTASQVGIGGLTLAAAGLIVEGNPLNYEWTPGLIGALVYLAVVGTSLTFGLLNWLIKHMDVTKTQLIPFACTLFALILGRVFLQESLAPLAAVGMLSIMAGLYYATLADRFKNRARHNSKSASVVD